MWYCSVALNEKFVMDASCDQSIQHDTAMRSQRSQTDARLENGLPEPQFCSLPVYKVVLHAKYALKAFKRNTAKAEENLKSYLTVVIFCLSQENGQRQITNSTMF